MTTKTMMKIIAITFCMFGQSYAQAEKLPLALVYAGPGVCDGCPESLAKNIKKSGFRVQLVKPGQLSHDRLAEASVFAVPGGDEEDDVKNALLPGEAENIREFVNQGGSYLGVCLGAFLAANWLTDNQSLHGLELFHGLIRNHSRTKEARMEDVVWRENHHWLYFQDGPEFILPDESGLADDLKTQVWAHYQTGAVAALQTKFGQGRVGLIGPHLEAENEWLKDDHLSDPDGLDGFLMQDFLQTLIRR